MAEDSHIALMCTEADPLRCHRTLLVSQELASRGTDIIHLMRDDQQSHEETMGKAAGDMETPPRRGCRNDPSTAHRGSGEKPGSRGGVPPEVRKSGPRGKE